MDVESLKKEKAKCKASYTRILHKLSDSLGDEAELPLSLYIYSMIPRYNKILYICGIKFSPFPENDILALILAFINILWLKIVKNRGCTCNFVTRFC